MNSAPSRPADEIETIPSIRSWVLRPRALGIFLIVTSVVGFLASFALSVEKYDKLANPNVKLSCDLNPFFSCGDVMGFPQSELFSFPNQLLGIAAFIFPLLIGVLLVAGTKLPGWVMIGLNIGYTLGVVLVMFLFYTSIYAIGVGCPWCIIVWCMTIPSFCAVTAHNTLAGNFGSGLQGNALARVLAKENLAIAAIWLIVIGACIVIEFWGFFSTLI